MRRRMIANFAAVLIALLLISGPAMALNNGRSAAISPSITSLPQDVMGATNADGLDIDSTSLAWASDLNATRSGKLQNIAGASGTDATLVGTPTLGGINGIRQSASRLDGVDDYFALPSQQLQYGNFTFMVWVKMIPTASNGAIVSEGRASSNTPYWTIDKTTTNTLQFIIRDDSNAQNAIDSTFVIGDNAWHFVSLTKSGTTYQMYIDGHTLNSPLTVSATLTLDLTSVGALVKAAPNWRFNGSMDELIIYKRALSSSEISLAYIETMSKRVPACLQYSYQPIANQTITTWSMKTNASFLSQSASGQITGTPTTLGSWYVNTTGTNANGNAWQNYSIRSYVTVAPIITGSPSLTIAETATYSATLTSDQTVTWAFSSNASWLHWNSSTHTVYGTPTRTDGNHIVTVTVTITNSNGNASTTWNISVSHLPLNIVTTPVTTAGLGDMWQYDVDTDLERAGWTNVTYYLVTSSNGISINILDGQVHGIIMDMNTIWLNITARDPLGGVAWQNFTIDVQYIAWNPQVSIRYRVDVVSLMVDFTGVLPENRTVNRFMWNFGDGNGSVEQNPRHQYELPGIYTVTFCGFDTYGNLGYYTTEIKVGNATGPTDSEKVTYWLDNNAIGAICVAFGAAAVAGVYVRYIAPKKGGLHWTVVALIAALAIVLIFTIYGGSQ